MLRLPRLAALLVALGTPFPAPASGPMPLQTPGISRSRIAFAYAGDLWVVGREGGRARRLAANAPGAAFPVFSPDGSQVAFARNVGGNWDVHIVSLSGGEPRRLTYHPEIDLPAGWSPDGKQVLLCSTRERSVGFTPRLYHLPVDGGFPTELPLPSGWWSGSFSPDGAQIAYMPGPNLARFSDWRNYRGGVVSRIWIARLADSRVRPMPHGSWNDCDPLWIGEEIYFVSDRTGTANLYCYHLRTGKTRRLTAFTEDDIDGAAACDDAIVFIRGGRLYLYERRSGRVRSVPIEVSEDFPEVKPRAVKARRFLRTFQLSPTGTDVALGARGEVLTLSLASGEVRNLTRSSGVAERSPVWSPNGRWIAYFSDASGEYQLHLHPTGDGDLRKIAIEPKPSFYRELTWSPDSRKLAFCDDRLTLWSLDLDTGVATRVVRGTYGFGNADFTPAWSPDSRWLAYSMFRPNYLRSVFLYSLAEKKSYPVTNDRADTFSPVFDRNGEYLYYVRAGNLGLNLLGLSRLPFEGSVPRSVHAAILRSDGLPPPAPAREGETVDAAKPLRIDVEEISRRTLQLFGAGDSVRLAAGEPGVLYALSRSTLQRMGPATRELQTVAQGVNDFRVSADGSRLAYQKGGQWAVVPTGAPPKAGEGGVDLDRVEIDLDPRAEWRQILHEACRIARDYFFDPGLHGQEIDALERKYAAYLPQVVTREGLNDLLRAMLRNLSVSHLNVGGGDVPSSGGDAENVGLLGADYRVEAGRYRFARIYRAASPNEQPPGPLAAPGLNVREGEYLLEMDGQPLPAGDNLYRRLAGKAGKSVTLRVGPRADGEGSRLLTVRPVASERTIRQLDWVESRRRMVEKLSGGRLAYIYLPDTGTEGFGIFNREFYAQLDREGLILDERFNSGGEPADYMIEVLRRAPISAYAFRDGKEMPFPTGCIAGPKVMIINEAAGSGGDTLPWMFRAAGIGPLVGKRTQGATIGNWVGAPAFIDGGTVQIPNRALFDPRTGRWDVENRGVAPDVEVETMPAEWLAGRDRQIEVAVRVALERLRKHPPPRPKRPRRGRW